MQTTQRKPNTRQPLKYVFIVGFSRTGSTLLSHILNNYTDIGVIHEPKFYWPRWLHIDFVTIVKNRIGKIDNDNKIDQLIQLMFSKKIRGVFWTGIERYKIDKGLLKQNIADSDRSLKGIIDALMLTLLTAHNKTTPGIKFPVHFLYVDKLIKLYPDCKIIHTIRDPRAIYNSQSRKRHKNFLSYITQFIHVNASFYGVAKMHEKLKICHSNNYFLCSYENLILKPEETLKKLCGFLEVRYDKDMLSFSMLQNTSLGTRSITKGFKTSSVTAWQQQLPNIVSWLIKTIQRKPMKKLGYTHRD